MKNKGFTLVEVTVVTGIGLGIATLIFSIFIVLNMALSRNSALTILKQQSQIAMETLQRYLEKSSPEKITIENCTESCRGNKITFQVPVVTDDAISGTAFDYLGNLKFGSYYTNNNGSTIALENGYFDLYVRPDGNNLILEVWQNFEVPGGGGGCFLAGTPVLMADGSTKPIEEIKPGDKVLAYNEKTGKTQKDKVVKLLIHNNAKRYLIINGELKVTPEHRFYSKGKWINIGSLKIGDKLLDYKGKTQEITSIKEVKAKTTVYNLTINPSHTYFAGGFLVHNRKYLDGPGEHRNLPGGEPTNIPWSNLFHNIFSLKEAYADTIRTIFNSRSIATYFKEIIFEENADKTLIKIKMTLEKAIPAGKVTYYAESAIAPLNK